MNDAYDQPPTFRALDESQGIYLTAPLPQEWPLERWFATVYNLPLEAFTLEDLAKACRQRLHLPRVVPFCLEVLSREPLAGELCDGELLCAVMELPPDYWHKEPEHLERSLPVARRALDEADEDLWKAILRFLEATS